jgi:hypothetical protein
MDGRFGILMIFTSNERYFCDLPLLDEALRVVGQECSIRTRKPGQYERLVGDMISGINAEQTGFDIPGNRK